MATFFKQGAQPPPTKLTGSAKSTDDVESPFSPRAKEHRARHKNERRRSSVGSVPTSILTPYQRKELARKARLEEERLKKEAELRKQEEKRLRARQLKANMKQMDTKKRIDASNKYKLSKDGSKYQCNFCGEFFEKSEIEDHIVTHPTMIRERLWLGNGINACDIDIIKSLQITHILNCTKEVALPKTISKLLRDFKRLPLIDKNSENLLTHLVSGLYFIDDSLASGKDARIFIHCKQGVSRSVSLVCSYLMWKEGLSYHSALGDVRSKRHIAFPNDKFSSQLQEFDTKLREMRKQKGSKQGSGSKQQKNSGKQGSKLESGTQVENTEETESAPFIRDTKPFKLRKFNERKFNEASKKYMELKSKHPDMVPHLSHVRSNSVDRASVINMVTRQSELDLLKTEINDMYATPNETPYDSENENENESENNRNDVDIESDSKYIEDATGTMGQSASGQNSRNNSKNKNSYKSKTFRLGSKKNNNNNKSSNSNNRSRASKSPKRNAKGKDSKDSKNSKDSKAISKSQTATTTVKTGKGKDKTKVSSINTNTKSSNNTKNKTNKSKSPNNSKKKGKKSDKKSNSKKKLKNNKSSGNGYKKDSDISNMRRHRRSSASAIETPSTPSRKFDLEFNIDSDLQKHESNISLSMKK